MTRALVFFLLLLLPWQAPAARPLVADMSQYRIAIDESFTGTRLLLFGSRNDIGEIVVAVRGPEDKFIVRKKERVAGIWVNRDQKRFDHVPAFYTLATSKPLDALHNPPLFAPLKIGLQEAVMFGHANEDQPFADALIRGRQAQGLYSMTGEKVSFMGESLFKLVIPFPDSIPGGDYVADVYLFNDNALAGMQSIPVHVARTGFDAFVYDVAHSHSVLYGLFAVLFALFMGWLASSIMQRL